MTYCPNSIYNSNFVACFNFVFADTSFQLVLSSFVVYKSVVKARFLLNHLIDNTLHTYSAVLMSQVIQALINLRGKGGEQSHHQKREGVYH